MIRSLGEDWECGKGGVETFERIWKEVPFLAGVRSQASEATRDCDGVGDSCF